MISKPHHLLFVALLLLGQVSGWLHELSHRAGGLASERIALFADGQDKAFDGSSLPATEDRQCQLCLNFAAMNMVLPGLLLALSLLSLQFAFPGAARQLPIALRPCACSARGPPLFS